MLSGHVLGPGQIALRQRRPAHLRVVVLVLLAEVGVVQGRQQLVIIDSIGRADVAAILGEGHAWELGL